MQEVTLKKKNMVRARWHSVGLGFLCGSALALAGCAGDPAAQKQTSQQQTMSAVSSTQDVKALMVLKPGDKLLIQVPGMPSLSGIVPVSAAGTLVHAELGTLDVSGLSLRGLEARLAREMKEAGMATRPVSVALLNPRSVYVIGEVERAGALPFMEGLSVAQAVAQAGGFTYKADEKRAFLMRAGEATESELMVERSAILLPGDIVRIEQRYF